MSDKRRRFRKPKEDKHQGSHRTITIARRNNNSDEPSTSVQRAEPDIVPKILLKPKATEKERDDENVATVEASQRAAISTRNETLNSQSNLASMKPDQPDHVSLQLLDSVPAMTRPATILSSTSVISSNVKRLLKDNNDFFVVGVIGTQGVGKSTILNLLANEDDDCDYYQKIFIDEEGYFPTKLKQFKNPSRSRTESTHMFITENDRMILLDIAPIMCNSYKKDMTTNELDDLHALVNTLSVCHLVIVVYRDYLNINFLRLLRLAELMKPDYTDYFPNLLFIKNRAKRCDFSIKSQKQTNDMLEAFFKDSKLRIYRGQTVEQQQRLKRSSTECELLVNSFVFPEVKGLVAVPFHKPLTEIINDLRWLVFSTPRNDISSGADQFTELAWFELFEKVTQTQHFFFKTYDEIHRNHFDGGNNTRELQENWKD